MKFLVAILAVHILFLSFRPAAAPEHLESAKSTACCEGGCKEDNTDHEEEKTTSDDCCGNACNPFQSCCALVVIAQPIGHQFSNKFISLSSLISGISSDPLPPGSMVDFWQPPRAV